MSMEVSCVPHVCRSLYARCTRNDIEPRGAAFEHRSQAGNAPNISTISPPYLHHTSSLTPQCPRYLIHRQVDSTDMPQPTQQLPPSSARGSNQVKCAASVQVQVALRSNSDGAGGRTSTSRRASESGVELAQVAAHTRDGARTRPWRHSRPLIGPG